MTEESGFSLDEFRHAAKELVRSGADVRERLKDLTVKALTQRKLAEQEVREVLNAITEGVRLGATDRTEEVRAALSSALHGMDDALNHAAEAMQLAMGEMASHGQEYAESDMKQSLNELKMLEEMLLDTLSRAAEGASGLVRDEMTALVEHSRRTGTGTGERVRAVVEDLTNRLRATVHQASHSGKEAAKEVGVRMATLASQKLMDIAGKLDQKAQALKQD